MIAKHINSPDLTLEYFFGVPIVVAVIITAIVFRPTKKGVNLSSVEPKLIPIIKTILTNYLSSQEKGRIISKKHLSSQLIPIMEEEIAAYKGFLANDVKTESKVKDINSLKFTILQDNKENIKIKISGLFKHDYFNNGKLLATPGDPNSYLNEDPKSTFNSSNYVFNFEKTNDGKYLLIGYTDNIMGNKYGKL
jgi:hypothetical protein